MSSEFIAICKRARVIPVIEIDDPVIAADLGAALLAGGLGIIELTLRTKAALPALGAMKAAHSTLIIGMGTILTPDDARRAADHGADFLVSPGLTDSLAITAKDLTLPFLPGVATPSDVMHAKTHGFDFLKFFPAQAAGGVTYLKSLAGPFTDICFCPTGGIGPDQVDQYLALDNVICVGGSWIAPRNLINAHDWASIKNNAKRATGK